MAQAPGYRRQLGASAPAGLPQASPGDFGAGIGAGIARLGDVLHEGEVRAYQIQRQQDADQQRADFAKRFADMRLSLDRTRTEARTTAAPGAAGHAQAIDDAYTAASAKLLDGITEDRVRRDAQEQLDNYHASLMSGEQAFETVRRATKIATDTGQAIDVMSAHVRTSGDPNAYAENTRSLDDLLNTLQGVDDETREKLRRDGHGRLAVAYGQNLIDTKPEVARAMIDAGAFNDVLPGEALDRLRAQADAAIARNAASARAVRADTVRAERERLGGIEAGLNAGAGTVADRQALADGYAAIDDGSKAAEWRLKATEFAATQGARDWTVPQMDRRIADLEAKRGKGGLSGNEAAELNGLTDQRRQSAARLDQPGGALLQMQYATGQSLAPVDPSDPASLRRRAEQAIVAAQTYGRVAIEPLTDTELPAFKDLMGNGPGGKIAALDAIRGFGDARVVLGAARQMSGEGDGDFRVAARLLLQPGGREVARDVLRGKDALKANPAIWNDRVARQDFNRWYGGVLRALPEDYRADLFDAAKGYYAARLSGSSKYDPGHFADAIENVLGRNVDGTGQTRGGIARTTRGLVLVPPTMTGEQLMQRFARATPDQYRAAANGRVPKSADGSPITVRDFKALLPTARGDGSYVFRYPSGRVVVDDRGQPYIVDPARLPGWQAPR